LSIACTNALIACKNEQLKCACYTLFKVTVIRKEENLRAESAPSTTAGDLGIKCAA